MKLLSFRTLFALTLTTGAGVVALIAACGTSSPAGYDNSTAGSSGGGSGGSGRPTAGTGASGDAHDGVGVLREMHGPRHPALGGALEAELALLLGQPWYDELEPFRHAAAGAPVRWLHATG